jgi:hypothetical protein
MWYMCPSHLKNPGGLDGWLASPPPLASMLLRVSLIRPSSAQGKKKHLCGVKGKLTVAEPHNRVRYCVRSQEPTIGPYSEPDEFSHNPAPNSHCHVSSSFHSSVKVRICWRPPASYQAASAAAHWASTVPFVGDPRALSFLADENSADIRPCVCLMKQVEDWCTDFYEIWYYRILRKILELFQSSFRSGCHNDNFTQSLHSFVLLSRV